MPTVRYGTLDAHYLDCGDGDPVVLLHAGASSGRQWQKIVDRLGNDYRLIAPDLIGFGRTPAWPGPDTLTHDHQAALVRSLIETVCGGPSHVVGHSYGGSTAARLAIRAPDCVKSLVLIEPNLVPLLNEAGDDAAYEEYRRFADAFMESAAAGQDDAAWQAFVDLRNGAGAWKNMPETSRARLRRITQQTVDGFKSNLSNPTTLAEIQRIEAPALVIRGADTTPTERRITEILARTLPNCSYATVSGGQHMSPVTHPNAVSMLIREHLAVNANARQYAAGAYSDRSREAPA